MDPRLGSHTFTFRVGGEKEHRAYNVFKIWDLASGLLAEEIEVEPLYKKLNYFDWSNQQRLLKALDKAIEFKDKAKIALLKDHQDRIQKADLSYPIILLGKPTERIIDGNHRVVKAFWTGVPYLLAKRFLKMPEEARIY